MSSLQSSTAPIKLACGSETILLVDDFAVLVDLTKAFLVKQGYTIYTALNGVEALKVLETKSKDICLVFTDVVMPLMGGPELALKVKQLYPKIKILFASGYAGDILEQYGMTPGLGLVMEKPYNFESLNSNIRMLFDCSSDTPMPS